jgi:FAD/FMN-containing dehydrogenase
MIDRRPGLIVQCAGEADVMAAVRLAAAHQLLVSVRGGGRATGVRDSIPRDSGSQAKCIP